MFNIQAIHITFQLSDAEIKENALEGEKTQEH